jgi:hypothetical protein
LSDASIAGASLAELRDPAELQLAVLTARIKSGIQIMHTAWGLAWLVGDGLFFLSSGPGNRVFVDFPSWLPLSVLLALLAIAGATTSILGVRVFSRRAVGRTRVRQAKRYGAAWLIGFAGLLITVGKVSNGLSANEQGLIWIVTTTGLVASLHLAGSAIWLDRSQFRLGAWLMLINVVGAICGHGWQALVVAVAGGGVMLYLGLVGMLRSRRRSSLPTRAL